MAKIQGKKGHHSPLWIYIAWCLSPWNLKCDILDLNPNSIICLLVGLGQVLTFLCLSYINVKSWYPMELLWDLTEIIQLMCLSHGLYSINSSMLFVLGTTVLISKDYSTLSHWSLGNCSQHSSPSRPLLINHSWK